MAGESGMGRLWGWRVEGLLNERRMDGWKGEKRKGAGDMGRWKDR